jgi:chromosome partitioning protein
MIITITSNKNSVGTSTIAVNNATLRALAGRNVLLIDIDPKKTASEWCARRKNGNIQPAINVHAIKGKYLDAELTALTSNYNDVLIDTDWRNTTGRQVALERSDIVVVPIELGESSVDDLKQVVRHIKVARRTNPNLWTQIVLVRAQDKPSILHLDEVRSYVANLPLTALCGTIIREQASLQSSFVDGLSIFEYKPSDPRAITEMHDLYRAQKMRRAALPSLSRLQG